MLDSSSSRGGMSLLVCCIWFSWIAYQLLLVIKRWLLIFSYSFLFSSCHAVIAFNLLLSILYFDLRGSVVLTPASLGHSFELTLVVSIIGLF